MPSRVAMKKPQDNSEVSNFDVPRGLLSRCMRVYAWDEEFSQEAIYGYRQFMQLKRQSEDWHGNVLSPPPIIDCAWLQHISDVEHYVHSCMEYCGNLIGHNPDDELDGSAQAERIRTTKLSRKLVFGNDWDAKVWSFGDDNDKQETPPQMDPLTLRQIINREAPVGSVRRRHIERVDSPDQFQEERDENEHTREDSDDPELRANSASNSIDLNFDKTPRKKITIQIRDQRNGDVQRFRIQPHRKMIKVFLVYAEANNLAIENCRFFYQSQRIGHGESVSSSGLHHNSTIDMLFGKKKIWA
jgi:hypothetical protein